MTALPKLADFEALPGFAYVGSEYSLLTLTQLDLRHREACRWLNLPGAHLWPEEQAQREAEAKACWQEMQRRKAVRS